MKLKLIPLALLAAILVFAFPSGSQAAEGGHHGWKKHHRHHHHKHHHHHKG